jgi:hypothetical protein
MIPCQNCGDFVLSRLATVAVNQVRGDAPRQLLVLSHAIRRMHARTEVPIPSPELILDITRDSRLPDPEEQVANLLTWLGESTRDLGDRFMAMPFGDAALDSLSREHVVPAVAATGFDLRRLDDNPPAGLIDDRLRVEIRTSRFLLANLTGENRDVYWEAGYAEGLGKPVSYVCERDYFQTDHVHFDTNHHHTVLYAAASPEEVALPSKSTIRATLPDEALLEDPAS